MANSLGQPCLLGSSKCHDCQHEAMFKRRDDKLKQVLTHRSKSGPIIDLRGLSVLNQITAHDESTLRAANNPSAVLCLFKMSKEARDIIYDRSIYYLAS